MSSTASVAPLSGRPSSPLWWRSARRRSCAGSCRCSLAGGWDGRQPRSLDPYIRHRSPDPREEERSTPRRRGARAPSRSSSSRGPQPLTLTRQNIGLELRDGTLHILVDGKRVGSIEPRDTTRTPIEPGRHTLGVPLASDAQNPRLREITACSLQRMSRLVARAMNGSKGEKVRLKQVLPGRLTSTEGPWVS